MLLNYSKPVKYFSLQTILKTFYLSIEFQSSFRVLWVVSSRLKFPKHSLFSSQLLASKGSFYPSRNNNRFKFLFIIFIKNFSEDNTERIHVSEMVKILHIFLFRSTKTPNENVLGVTLLCQSKIKCYISYYLLIFLWFLLKGSLICEIIYMCHNKFENN